MCSTRTGNTVFRKARRPILPNGNKPTSPIPCGISKDKMSTYHQGFFQPGRFRKKAAPSGSLAYLWGYCRTQNHTGHNESQQNQLDYHLSQNPTQSGRMLHLLRYCSLSGQVTDYRAGWGSTVGKLLFLLPVLCILYG